MGDKAKNDDEMVNAVKKDYEDLEGTPKQVKWAESIRDEWARKFVDNPEELEALAYLDDAKKIIDGRDGYPSNLVDAKRVDIVGQNDEVIGSRYITNHSWEQYSNGELKAYTDGKAKAGDVLLDVVRKLHSIDDDEVVSLRERD